VFPETDWSTILPSYDGNPLGWWKDVNNQREFIFNSVMPAFNLKSIQELQTLSKENIKQAGGRQLFRYYTSWFECLCKGRNLLSTHSILNTRKINGFYYM
jgi:hypothetical protein